MTTVLTTLRRATRNKDLLGTIVVALFSAAAVALLVPSLQDPAHIDQLTIDNRHAWRVNVRISDATGLSWVGLGAVDREDQRTFHDILDQGDNWTIRFTYAGRSSTVATSRTELGQTDWQVTVPQEFADQLRRADVPETP